MCAKDVEPDPRGYNCPGECVLRMRAKDVCLGCVLRMCAKEVGGESKLDCLLITAVSYCISQGRYCDTLSCGRAGRAN